MKMVPSQPPLTIFQKYLISRRDEDRSRSDRDRGDKDRSDRHRSDRDEDRRRRDRDEDRNRKDRDRDDDRHRRDRDRDRRDRDDEKNRDDHHHQQQQQRDRRDRERSPLSSENRRTGDERPSGGIASSGSRFDKNDGSFDTPSSSYRGDGGATYKEGSRQKPNSSKGGRDADSSVHFPFSKLLKMTVTF